MKRKFKVYGMSCAACSARVERAVASLEGVITCSVNLLTGTMNTEGDADEASIIGAVEKAGYSAEPEGEKKLKTGEKDNNNLQNSDKKRIAIRLAVSAFILLPLMYIAMGVNMWGFPAPELLTGNPMSSALLQMLLALAVLIINRRFFESGVRAVIRLSPNMDTLVSLGSGASFIWSVVLLFLISDAVLKGDMVLAHEHLHNLYFESSAMILVLITVGKMLESAAKERTTDAIRALMDLSPKMARIMVDGEERDIPASEIKVGDIFVLRPGDAIPADGVVVFGEGAVSESALTGESVPQDKSVGDRVLCATVNTNGYMRCEAQRVGENTAISDVIRLVSDASATKAPIAKLADRVSGIFVPVVIAIASVAFLVWLVSGAGLAYSLARGISVLVISCPCALGLATPVAIMVGNGVGARRGILFKNAQALELCAGAKTVILDKTGTVTAGEPSVTDIISRIGEGELLRIAVSLEAQSEHPLARAVVNHAQSEGIVPSEVSGFEALAGSGVSAELAGEKILSGKLSFIENYVKIDTDTKKEYERLSLDGKTVLFFAAGERYIGMIAVMDAVKDDSKDAISRLKEMGIKTVMLTGDNEKVASAIGNEVGVDEIIAGVLPDGKERAVAERLGNGKVIMVGDGINDAPAIMRADVGIAIGAGADIAIDSADIVITSSRISDVVSAISISKKTLKNIKENLFWAFFYNALGIPLAAGVFVPLFGWELSPMFGAFAMSISSLFVVCNALRLRFYGEKKENPKNTLKMVENNHDGTENNEKIGDFEMMEKTFYIEGMMCPHCEGRVKAALDACDGVIESAVSFKEGTAKVTIDTLITDKETLKAAIEAAGYPVNDIR